MIVFDCPQCGNEMISSTANSSFGKDLSCSSCNCHFKVDSSISPDKIKVWNLILEFLLQNPKCIHDGHEFCYHFFYDEKPNFNDNEPCYINIAHQLKNYPKNVIEKINRVLLNLSIQYPNIGDKIDWLHKLEHRLLFCDTDNQDQEALTMISYLKGLDYFIGDPLSGTGNISVRGWEKIGELSKSLLKNQGFIAIGYTSTESILKSIKETIENGCNTNYIAMVISEKQHNNQIVPEIFYEIRQSKFVVVDVTYPNYGAYYEAGYAEALGKPVIICCRKKEFDEPNSRPHFDIAQKSSIIWKDEADLRERLKRRIESTVK